MTAKTAKPRASLKVRIVIIVAAVVLALGAVFAAVNLYAVYVYNQATQSLQTNLDTAADESADLQMLSIQQEQTDSQFDEADAVSFLLLPQIRDAVEQNTETSHLLTERIEQELADQQGSDGAVGDVDADALSDSDSAGGLTEEQREQIEELLESNQPSTSSDADDNDDQSDDDSDDDEETTSVKPW